MKLDTGCNSEVYSIGDHLGSCCRFKMNMVASDFGGGAFPNGLEVRDIGSDEGPSSEGTGKT